MKQTKSIIFSYSIFQFQIGRRKWRFSNRKPHRTVRDLSLGTASNLWILSVAMGFMGIQCLNWKIIGQCLEADRSSHSPLLNAYNRPLTDS